MTSTALAPAWRDELPIKLANIVAYALFSSANVYAVFGSHGKHRTYESYLTPSQWFFSIWGVIHVLFLGLLVYQFTARGTGIVKNALGWKLPVLLVLNSASDTLFTMHDSLLNILGFVVLTAVAALISQLYGEIRMSTEPVNRACG